MWQISEPKDIEIIKIIKDEMRRKKDKNELSANHHQYTRYNMTGVSKKGDMETKNIFMPLNYVASFFVI
jgi:hypothetical protein